MADAIAWVDPTLAATEGTFNSGDLYTPPGTDKNGVAYPTGGRIYTTMALARAAFAGTGNRCYFRRGMYHVPDDSFITAANTTFSDYGATSLAWPKIDCNNYMAATPAEDALWTHTGGGVWTRALAGASNYTSCRLWTGATSNNSSATTRTQGLARRRAYTNTTVNATSIWHVQTIAPWTITVYTGSTTQAPPTFYNGIIINQIGASINKAFVFRNGANNGSVSYLEIIGAATACLGANTSASDVTGLTIENVRLTSCNDGVIFSGPSGGAAAVRNFKLRNFVIDANTTAVEIDLTPSDWMNADWISLVNYALGGLIENGLIYTANCHTALNTDNTLLVTPTGCTFRNIKARFLLGTNDGRGIGMNCVSDLVFENVYTYGAAAHGQVSGTRIRFQNCGWQDMQFNAVNTSECAQLMAVMSRTGNIASTSSGIVFDHCFFDTRASSSWCVGALAFICYNTTGAVDIPLNAVTVTNSLSLHGSNRGFIVNSPLTVSATAIAQNQNIQYNVASPISGTAVNKVGVVNYTPEQYTDEGLNVTLGAANNLSVLQSALDQSGDFRPRTSTSPLVGVGLHNGYRADGAGAQFYNPPSIGPFEYQRAASIRP